MPLFINIIITYSNYVLLQYTKSFLWIVTAIFFLLQYKLTVPKMGNIADLLAILSKETNIPKEKVV